MAESQSGKYRFSRELRLLTPAHFTHVFSDAIPVSTPNFTFLARFNQHNCARIGITIAKKRVKRAVERNRIKRHIREVFRHQCAILPPVDIIVIAKSGCDKLGNHELNDMLTSGLIRLAKRCRKKATQ